MSMERKNCPECKSVTPHKTESYNPEDPDSFYIWVCTICGEGTEIANGEKGSQD